MNTTINSLDQIVSILNDDSFSSEINIFTKSYVRLKTRLRNNTYIASLKQTVVILKRFQEQLPPQLLYSYRDWLISFKGKKKQSALKNFNQSLIDFTHRANKIVDKTLLLYSLTQAQLTVGHLVHHLIVISSSLARIRVLFRALAVYGRDIRKACSAEACKTRDKSNSMQNEEIGPVIDRKTMKAVKR